MNAKTCAYCKQRFTPIRSFQKNCLTTTCIEANNQKIREKQKKVNRKAKKDFYMNDKSWLIARCKEEVQKYARLRDYYLPCISCPATNAKWDGGHYMSAGGHSQLMFYTLNINKQCFRCNQVQSANLKDYKIGLIEKIGAEKVDEIENNKSVKRYSIEYLQKLLRVMRKKNRQMKKRIEDKQ